MNQILLLAGDGIGPEIMKQAEKILAVLKPIMPNLASKNALVGGASFNDCGKPLSEKTLDLARESDAILLGAVGGYQWETLPRELRPERGLLALRSELDLFANLRPAICYKSLVESSSLKREKIEDLDLLIIRELVSGIYFGEPRGIKLDKIGKKIGYNTLCYHEDEIRRIAHIGFQSAMKRNKKLTSVDKANVLESMELWREVMIEVSKDYPEVELDHLYVDNAAMKLIANPKEFDVIVCGNLFGDILSDSAAQLTGSIGMLPSASLDAKQKGMFEPVHGSAPDIAGQDRANPIAMILSLAMVFRYSLNQVSIADKIELSVNQVIEKDYATKDFYRSGQKLVGTDKMGDLIAHQLKNITN